MTIAAAPGAGEDLAAQVRRCTRRLKAPVRHLYVHHPFCRHRCPYCDFNTYAGRDAEQGAYVEGLAREIEAWRPYLAPETIFVGGGTPTHPDPHLLARLLEVVVSPFPRAALREVTVEANPGSLTPAKVRTLRRGGVDRVSLGAQSFDDEVLRLLGRAHGSAEIGRSVELLRRGGVRRLSIDLMLAVPGQDVRVQERDVSRALDLEPEHVSAYVLTYEEGTPFHQALEAGKLPPPVAERELAHLHLVRDRLEAAGLARYEVSNFSRPGAACQHNLAYWRTENWLGVGAGAHSHLEGRRWRNEKDPARYASLLRTARAPVDFEEEVSPTARLLEHLLMGLRLTEGIDVERVREATSRDPLCVLQDPIETLVAQDLLWVRGERLGATRQGLDVLNAVLRFLAQHLRLGEDLAAQATGAPSELRPSSPRPAPSPRPARLPGA